MAQEKRYDVYDSPVSTEDAASMLRRRVQKNDRPYISTTTKLNNKKVDVWKNKVLNQLSNHKGCVPSGRVWQSWVLFDEGNSVRKYIKLRDEGLIPRVDTSTLEFWKDFFEKLSVNEMHSYGAGTVSAGWTLIKTYIQTWFIDQKYEKLFSKSSDPLYWEKNYHKHTDIINGKVLPFWNEEKLKEIQEKVAAILFNQVKPQEMNGYR